MGNGSEADQTPTDIRQANGSFAQDVVLSQQCAHLDGIIGPTLDDIVQVTPSNIVEDVTLGLARTISSIERSDSSNGHDTAEDFPQTSLR
jgi:hypothetical protein